MNLWRRRGKGKSLLVAPPYLASHENHVHQRHLLTLAFTGVLYSADDGDCFIKFSHSTSPCQGSMIKLLLIDDIAYRKEKNSQKKKKFLCMKYNSWQWRHKIKSKLWSKQRKGMAPFEGWSYVTSWEDSSWRCPAKLESYICKKLYGRFELAV